MAQGKVVLTPELGRFLKAAVSAIHDLREHIRWEGNRPTSEPFDWTTNCQHPDCRMVREALASASYAELDADGNVQLDADGDPIRPDPHSEDWYDGYASAMREIESVAPKPDSQIDAKRLTTVLYDWMPDGGDVSLGLEGDVIHLTGSDLADYIFERASEYESGRWEGKK